jgi:hypothetical protein
VAIRQPKYSKEEFAARGDALYQQRVRPRVEAAHAGEVVAIDIDSGEFEIGANMLAACEALLARMPDAQIWCVRVSSGRKSWGLGLFETEKARGSVRRCHQCFVPSFFRWL